MSAAMQAARPARTAPQNAEQEARAALERLLKIGAGDTGQSRRVADFLLAWWNVGTCGGFDITPAWGCDAEIVRDMVRVFAFAVTCRQYPDALGYERQFKAVIREWRPELLQGVRS